MVIVKAVALLVLHFLAFLLGYGWAGRNNRQRTRHHEKQTDSRPVTLGSRFGDWTVCWLGGWSRHRLYYLVMLARLTP